MIAPMISLPVAAMVDTDGNRNWAMLNQVLPMQVLLSEILPLARHMQFGKELILVEDIDHALHKCPHAFLVWRELVKPLLLDRFMKLKVKEWVRENLRKGAHFDKESCMRDVFFGV
ncbi:hypothetical protein V6N13_004222 [Hibiscus sabdariffa]